MSVDVKIIHRKTNTKKPSSVNNALIARTALSSYVKAGKQKHLEPEPSEPEQEIIQPVEDLKIEQIEPEEESEPEPEPIKKKKKIKIPEPESESSSDEEIIVQRVSKTKVLKDELDNIKDLLKKFIPTEPKLEPKKEEVKQEPKQVVKPIQKPSPIYKFIKF